MEKSTKNKHMSARYNELRENLWPDSSSKIWTRRENDGYSTVPRVLPLIMHLITILDKRGTNTRGNASRVYLDLWCRVFDEGFVEVTDEKEFAYSSGYASDRGVRTWRESVFRLRDMGFVEISARGNRDIGYVLILDPLAVAEHLHKKKRVPEEWWNEFVGRTTKIRALLPSEKRRRAALKAKEATAAAKSN